MKRNGHLLRVNVFVFAFILCYGVGISQVSDTASLEGDTVSLQEVIITAYPVERPLFQSPASVSVLDAEQLDLQQNNSLVSSFNTITGVRMEERSPGSYRLSIRGSLLRSPFGVRNVKVYLDEFSLTNAGGDTYLNLLDKYCVERIEVIKGPDGSLFGANSGGVVKITPVVFADSSKVEVNAEAGSFKMWHLQGASQVVTRKNTSALSMAWQTSDGYRDHSAMERKYLQFADRWGYRPGSQLRLIFFYSGLDYETPGGLTLEQHTTDPSAARYPTATLPGSEEQKAGVQNNTYYAGVANDIKISRHLRHVLALFGSYTDFSNPFITNYETREEISFGLRTWMEGEAEWEKTKLAVNLGSEFQQTHYDISNYENNGGAQGELQVSDDLKARNSFVFLQTTTEFLDALIIEAALSLNLNRLYYSNIYPVERPEDNVPFKPQTMPRIGISYSLNNIITWRFTVSRGYSVPTLSEIRSSDNTINTSLQPENGWNYEIGYRIRTLKKIHFWWDLSLFYYRLHDAIVVRVNNTGQEYFTNAGGTRQPGIESHVNFDFIPKRNHGVVRQLSLHTSYAYHHFIFSDYSDEAEDFSSNELTGVPRHTIMSGLTVELPVGFYFFCQHNFTGTIPLDDGNSVYADAYNLVQIKAGWNRDLNRKWQVALFAGIDNLLNQKYSLGNDLNAAGERYYNAAPVRNYSGGMKILFQ